MSKLKNKLENCKYNYSKSFVKSLIAPLLVVVLSIVFIFVLGFNKDLDFSGGVLVSVVADPTINLYENEQYESFKKEVDAILAENNVNGKLYTVELNQQQEYSLVVKFAFDGTDEERQLLIDNLNSDLISAFYSNTQIEDIENNNYVLVEAFGSSLEKSVILTTALACLIGAILMCAYISLRVGFNAGILTFVNALLNNILTLALLMVARVPLSYATIAVVPFVTILSILSAFILLRKCKVLLNTTQKYEKESNHVLVNDAVKKVSYSFIIFTILSIVSLTFVGVVNFNNSVLFVSLAFILSILSTLYTTIMLIPGLFAMTYVRKFKKEKVKKVDNNEKKLTQDEIMKETDLDNLVSN